MVWCDVKHFSQGTCKFGHEVSSLVTHKDPWRPILLMISLYKTDATVLAFCVSRGNASTSWSNYISIGDILVALSFGRGPNLSICYRENTSAMIMVVREGDVSSKSPSYADISHIL